MNIKDQYQEIIAKSTSSKNTMRADNLFGMVFSAIFGGFVFAYFVFFKG